MAFQLLHSKGDPSGHLPPACPVLCQGQACLKLDQGQGGDRELYSQNQGEKLLGCGSSGLWKVPGCEGVGLGGILARGL